MSGIRIVVAGAAGRMGGAVIQAIAQARDCKLTGALDSKTDAAAEAARALGIAITSDPSPLLQNADVLIDFTVPQASVSLARAAAQAHVALVTGTTGLSADDETKIHEAAKTIPVVRSGNMSVGVTLLAALAKQAAKVLPDFDIEIFEMHHRQKADAPSGTALLLAEAAAAGRNVPLKGNDIRGRDGVTGTRKEGAIGFVSLRGGTVVGEHDVIFAGPHERVVLRHVAEDRAIFANGALAAARWVKGKAPGLYSMADVLGL